MKISIIIISYNTLKLTSECIHSINKYLNAIDYEIIVVDNNSDDGSPQYIKEHFPKVKVIENSKNFGYAKAVNIGMKNAVNEICVIMNSDIVIFNDSLIKAFEYIDNSYDIGVLGVQQLFPDKSWQRSYGKYPSIKLALENLFFITSLRNLLNRYLYYRNIRKIKNVEYIDGALLIIKKSIFNKLNGFDESYFFYTEEVDFAYRLKSANYKRIFFPYSEIIHYRGGSQKKDKVNIKSLNMMVETNIYFFKKNISKNNFLIKIFIVIEYLHNKKLELINLMTGNKFKKMYFQEKAMVYKKYLKKGYSK